MCKHVLVRLWWDDFLLRTALPKFVTARTCMKDFVRNNALMVLLQHHQGIVDQPTSGSTSSVFTISMNCWAYALALAASSGDNLPAASK